MEETVIRYLSTKFDVSKDKLLHCADLVSKAYSLDRREIIDIIYEANGNSTLPKLAYSPENDKIKHRLNTDKFKVCSTSLFRPVIRNKRYKEYYNGIFTYLDSFSNIYPLSDNWILRVYVDDSLFSNDYSYSDKSNVKQWDGNYESVKWRQCIKKLKEAKNVQIVKFECPQFKDPEHPDYHLGYFGSIARFFSMFDSDVEVTIFRNLNKNVLECDKLSVYNWIDTGKKFHASRPMGYSPPHFSYYQGQLVVIPGTKEYYTRIETANKKYRESKLKGSLLAGLWGARYVDDLGLWNNIVEDLFCEIRTDRASVEKCFDWNEKDAAAGKTFGFAGKKLKYGIDEIILSGAIFNYMTKTSLLLQPIYYLKQVVRSIDADHVEYMNMALKKKGEELGVKPSRMDYWRLYSLNCDYGRFDIYQMGSTEDEEKYAEAMYYIMRDNPDKICRELFAEHIDNIGEFDKLLIWEYLLAKPGTL